MTRRRWRSLPADTRSAKTHGAADADQYVGPEPEGAGIKEQGLGWKSSFGSGKAGDTITSGLEGAWTTEPAQWDNGFFDNLFGYEWEQVKSPARGDPSGLPSRPMQRAVCRNAHDPSKRHAPMMLTTDLALKVDSIYAPIAKRFHENPQAFADAFAKAWYKLTHPRHGAPDAVSRPVGSGGATVVAGPPSPMSRMS